MNTTAAMHPSVSVMPRFYARAKQYLHDRDRPEDADEAQIESIAQWLRYEEFPRRYTWDTFRYEGVAP